MMRRSHADVRRETVVAERAGVLAHRRVKDIQIASLIERGRLTASEGSLIKNCLRAFADEVAQGLHVEGDPTDVRAAMREVVLGNLAEGGEQ